MALLNDPIAQIGTASLIIQLIVFSLLIYGYSLKRRLKFRKHGITMSVALVLHLIMIFVIMIPSFILAVVPMFIIPAPLESASIVAIVHGIAGITTIVFGVGLVSTWRFNKDFTGCYKRKKYMLITITAWITTLVFGIILYAIFYGPALIS